MKYSLSPQAYQEIVNDLSLEEIVLKELTLKVYDENQSSDLTLSTTRNYKKEIIDGFILNDLKYSLTAKDETAEKTYFKIAAKYRLKYNCDCDPETLSDDFFKIFLNFTLEIIIWPYFRELVQSLVSKMNLPPLVLPMKKAVIG